MAEKDGKTPKGKKRKQKDDEESQDSQEESFVVDDDEEEGEATPAAKKQKMVFKIPSEWAKLIAEDTKNAKTWAQVADQIIFRLLLSAGYLLLSGFLLV